MATVTDRAGSPRFLHNGRIKQGGRVAEVVISPSATLRRMAHDLAAARFGQAAHELDLCPASVMRPMPATTASRISPRMFSPPRWCRPARRDVRDHVRIDALALDVVRVAHHRALHHALRLVDRVLDLGRAEAGDRSLPITSSTRPMMR